MKINFNGKLISCMALISCSLLVYAYFGFVRGAVSARPPQEYVVQPGDTLWHIARSFSSPQRDLRIYIHRLKKLNQLDDPIIHPGQCLLLPAP